MPTFSGTQLLHKTWHCVITSPADFTFLNLFLATHYVPPQWLQWADNPHLISCSMVLGTFLTTGKILFPKWQCKSHSSDYAPGTHWAHTLSSPNSCMTFTTRPCDQLKSHYSLEKLVFLIMQTVFFMTVLPSALFAISDLLFHITPWLLQHKNGHTFCYTLPPHSLP
jgi:hypothetical protein